VSEGGEGWENGRVAVGDREGNREEYESGELSRGCRGRGGGCSE
jgi:hypothetical protein